MCLKEIDRVGWCIVLSWLKDIFKLLIILSLSYEILYCKVLLKSQVNKIVFLVLYLYG